MNRSLAGSIVFGTVILSILIISGLSCGRSETELFTDSGSSSDSDISDEVDSDTSPDSDTRDEHDSDSSDSDEIEGDADETEEDADEDEAETDADEEEDADVDEPETVGTCETCIDDESCEEGSRCVVLADENVCLEECDPGSPHCLRGYDCVNPGDDGNEVCHPLGGSFCCIDNDGDWYGEGVDCLGPDCDDTDDHVYPGADEYCNGIDDDCDSEIDNDPMPCDDGCDPECELECIDGEWVHSGAIDCGPYGFVCGSDPCPTSCATDTQCYDGAHCSGGDCRWDLIQGTLCERDRECEDRRCIDSRCCDSTCGGECESCANSDGECRAIPAGTDPDGECFGFPCTDYYTGFDVGNTCYRRAPVSDADCNGMRECESEDILCPLQPIGETIITCDEMSCLEPTPGTCVFGTPGRCDRLPIIGPPTCGLGICESKAHGCGVCVPLDIARPENCNSLDDDCDGTTDEDDPDDMCGGHPTVEESACIDGTCEIVRCVPGRFALDDDYDNGCESEHP